MKYPAEHYTREEVDAILNACPNNWVGFRNRALIVVMWRSGLRLFEALALRPVDIDHEHQTIRVLHGKGDKARTVGIDTGGLEYIDAWLKARSEYITEDDFSLLFCTGRGREINQSYVRRTMTKLGRKAHIAKRVHAHGFRHTFAVELAREGVSMINIQRLLGHASLATTSVYLASLSPEEALDAVRVREW